jgi:hypothetical protein
MQYAVSTTQASLSRDKAAAIVVFPVSRLLRRVPAKPLTEAFKEAVLSIAIDPAIHVP